MSIPNQVKLQTIMSSRGSASTDVSVVGPDIKAQSAVQFNQGRTFMLDHYYNLPPVYNRNGGRRSWFDPEHIDYEQSRWEELEEEFWSLVSINRNTNRNH